MTLPTPVTMLLDDLRAVRPSDRDPMLTQWGRNIRSSRRAHDRFHGIPQRARACRRWRTRSK